MISTIVEIGADLADALLGAWFVTRYNDAKFRGNRWLVPAVLIPFLFQLLADRLSLGMWSSAIQFVLLLAYAFLIAWNNRIRAFVSVCICKVSLIALSSALFLLYGLLYPDFSSFMMGSDGFVRGVYVMTHKILLLAVLKLILHLVNREHVSKAGGGLTFAFSVMTVFALSFLISAAMKTEDHSVHVLLFAAALVFCFLNVFLYAMLSLLSESQKQNYELKLRNEVMASEASRYQEGLTAWHNAEQIRHDVKHQLTAAAGLLEADRTEECRALLNEYLTKTENSGRFNRSGNAVIDYLIDAKLSGLDNTEIVVTGTVDNLDDIAPTDLASLIGNILDNAAEAEEKVADKRIELLFTQSGGSRFIVCKNNIESSVLENNRALRTTKKGSHHGYGTGIVAEIVQKYGGMMEYFESGGMFGVQIMLPGRMR